MHVATPEGLEYLDESAGKIEHWESRVHWLYLDRPGLVTVGVGRMLPTVEAAQALPFKTSEGQPATAEHVAHDFNRVHAMEPNHLATFYLCAESIRLASSDIEALLFTDVTDCDRWIRKQFTHYDAWPKCAKLATIDMRYNLGPKRFLRYTEMIRGLNSEDWELAAKECDRNIRDAAFAARNYWTRCQFLDAAKEVNAHAAA